MSASEKLRALDAELGMPPLDDLEMIRYYDARESVLAALPQIVAVVEAAERFGDEDETAMAWANIKRDIRAALAALDEALGDVT